MSRPVDKRAEIQPGGVIRVQDPDFPVGANADVVVFVEDPKSRREMASELDRLFRETRLHLAGVEVTEEEIQAAIDAARAAR